MGARQFHCTFEKVRILTIIAGAGSASSLLAGHEIENFYQFIGGDRTIEAATDRFYKKVLGDDNLRPFKRTDMAHLRSRQVVVSMQLGGRMYTGKDIRSAHDLARSHGLNDSHFDMCIHHFRAALHEVGVKPEHTEIILKLLERKRSAILDPWP